MLRMSFDFFFSPHSLFVSFLDIQVLLLCFQKSHKTPRLSSLLLRILACHGAGSEACQGPLVSVYQHAAVDGGLES